MATQNILNRLVPGQSGGAVASALHIAYSTKEQTFGDDTIEVIDKSLKDKIDEIAEGVSTTADKIQYDENTTVKDKLDEIDKVKEYSESAQTAYNNVRQLSTTLNTNITDAKSDIELAEKRINETVDKLGNLSEDVADLKASFDPNAQIEIMSETAYGRLTQDEIESNTIYLLYEGN